MHICIAGTRLDSSPVRSIVQCLARKEGTDEFFTLKVSATSNVLLLIKQVHTYIMCNLLNAVTYVKVD